jgi:hypothetical protein
MGNMGYCRFQNTLNDLKDCRDAMSGGDLSEMSNMEEFAFTELILLCREIAEQFEDYSEDEIKQYVKDAQGSRRDFNNDEDED